MLDRLRLSAHMIKYITHYVVGLGIIGIKAQEIFVIFDRLLGLARQSQGIDQVVVRLKIVGLQP